jgi:hypothetical protein
MHGVRLVGNAGWSILEDPVKIGIQNDVVTYGGSMEAAIRSDVRFVIDLSGRWSTRHGTPPAGTESRAMTRVGARFDHGHLCYDAGVQFGHTKYAPSWGIATGLTWTSGFKAP